MIIIRIFALRKLFIYFQRLSSPIRIQMEPITNSPITFDAL